MIYHVFYSKFYWSVLYTTFDPIIFVQATRFCLLYYLFIYCILYFLFYFSCLYYVVLVFCLDDRIATTINIIITAVAFIVTVMPNVILLILIYFYINSVLDCCRVCLDSSTVHVLPFILYSV